MVIYLDNFGMHANGVEMLRGERHFSYGDHPCYSVFCFTFTSLMEQVGISCFSFL